MKISAKNVQYKKDLRKNQIKIIEFKNAIIKIKNLIKE
jgi:hypothetical protein